MQMESKKDTTGPGDNVNIPIWADNPLPSKNPKPALQKLGTWTEIRLFLSSTFIDTHAERDVLIKHVIPNINRKLSARFIRVVPVDLRWGVLAEESKDCKTIQKTCLNQIDKCRRSKFELPWFIGLRTERYGWVQDELMASYGFENPELYSWIDQWNKNVSITSLECMHAAQIPKQLQVHPTVFFYERVLENPENVEKNLKWLFDFEYVTPDIVLDPEIRFQYSVTEKADSYKTDQNELNRVLKNLPYIQYSKYKCHYNKGRARYTYKRENAKSFGVAYVDGLEEFQEKVEEDLLKAIEMNFQSGVFDNVSRHQLENVQHEISIEEKAAVFVGRSELVETGWGFCSGKLSDTKENVMIIHGDPGCGKSGLLSAISKECLAELPKNGDFLFVHVVDSCPGSNILAKMLKRLQLNLREFRRNLGESDLSLEVDTSAFELKKQHHDFLEESANEYPDKSFVLIIDAVNQFHESLQAWKMWWLPRQSCPKNVRFMITSLTVENGTFENACKVSHNAVCVPVKEMSDEDLQEMVTVTLGRFNKKLTISDDRILGNQMELLISKNKSPLYITAVCEALRRFGIFEKISGYLSKLPTNVQDLFWYLLDEWSEEYGREIVEDIAGFLYVSRDGLLENEINDLLRFKENALKGPDGFLYQSSFSRLYDSLSSFLSSGGGGYLHFFHDQLKYTVKKKYFDKDISEKLFHGWLSKFYYDVIKEQIKEKPGSKPRAYYEHALQQIVYHQLQSVSGKDSLSLLSLTLRNIYFVRERIRNHQVHDLNQEYIDAIERSSNEEELLALKEWAKFVQLFAHVIYEFPDYCYNMAINEIVTSNVKVDTQKLSAPEYQTSGYPFYWKNNPNTGDSIVVKYSYGKSEQFVCGFEDCVVSATDKDICCAVNGEKGLIFDQSSGEVLHEMDIEGHSLALSSDFKSLWVGDEDGGVSLWDVSTGTLIKETDVFNGRIIWLELIDDILACGTGSKGNAIAWKKQNQISEIALFSVEKYGVLKKWSTEAIGHCFCYHKIQRLIFSGHKGFINGWSEEGILQFTLPDAGNCVYSLCAHPVHDIILSGSNDSYIRQWSIANQKMSNSFLDQSEAPSMCAGNWCVQYDATGERILTSSTDSSFLKIYNLNGVLQDELKGHLERINKICLVPESNHVLTSEFGRLLILWKLPSFDADKVKEFNEDILRCEFLPSGDEYMTLSMNFIRIWDTNTQRLINFADTDNKKNICYTICAVVHPSGEYICLGKEMDVYWYKLPDLAMVHSFRALDVSPIGDSVKNFVECEVHGLKISPDFSKLLVVERRHGDKKRSQGIVFDVNDIKNVKEHLIYREHTWPIDAWDIHSDSIQAVTCGAAETMVWSIVTGETFYRFGNDGQTFVKFFTKTNRILYDDDASTSLKMRDLSDNSNVITLSGNEYKANTSMTACLYENESLVVSAAEDGSVRVYDTTLGRCVYGFFQPQAQGYTTISIHPSRNLFLAANKNRMIYSLQAN